MDPAARRRLPGNRSPWVAVHPSCRECPSAVGKFVIAAESPWAGELYRRSAGKPRLQFTSVETFCSAFLAATGWELQPASSATQPPTASGAGTDRICTQTALPIKQKYIVSATAPWNGEIYRTRPGLGHFGFTTFEGFLGAVLAITGWPLMLERRA
jgi:hypothetical protein